MNVPDGWSRATVAAVVSSIRAGVSLNGEDRIAGVDEVAVLRTGAVLRGRFDATQQKVVAASDAHRLRTPVTANSIILCRKNSEKIVGSSVLVETDMPNLYLSDLLWEIRATPTTNIKWLSSVLQSVDMRSRLQLAATGTQPTMKNISRDRLLNVPLIVPPLSEQNKIAEILRAWDDAIEQNNALRAIRTREFTTQANSQLHPTNRPNKWNSYRLGDLFYERTEIGRIGDVLLSVTQAEGLVSQESSGRKDSSSAVRTNYKLVLPGDIAYNTMRMWQGASGLADSRGVVSPAYTVVTPVENLMHGAFAARLFKTHHMKTLFESFSQGITSDTWNLKFPAFGRIEVRIPSVEQQIRIAAYLDGAAKELRLLRDRSNLLQQQKRGLMQKLLTGEIRVNATDEIAPQEASIA